VISGEESLTAENRAAEEVYLGLRTRQGLEIAGEERTRVQTWDTSESADWTPFCTRVSIRPVASSSTSRSIRSE